MSDTVCVCVAMTELGSLHICTWLECQDAAKELKDKADVWTAGVCMCVSLQEATVRTM